MPESRASGACQHYNREKISMTNPGANDVLRRFNRDTRWFVAGLLGVLFFAALAFAVLIPEPHPATAGLQVTSGTLAHVGQVSTESSSKESVARTEAAAGSTPAPILFLPEPSPSIATANVSNWSPAQPKESVQAIRGKAPYRRGKSSDGLGDVDVENRLIELWHQSLMRTEKPRSWAIFSKLERKKKAAFTARKQP
jgi:hypothetical protein